MGLATSVMNITESEEFKFHSVEFNESDNGLLFNGIYLPEELVLEILSYIEPKQLLELSLVCRKWCRIIKTWPLWAMKYQERYKRKPERLPWYVFYHLFTSDSFNNLIKNGNGELGFEHWTILQNGGDKFIIEDPPQGADPLPAGVPEFNGKTSCFATSYYPCIKAQKIDLRKNKLLLHIIKKFKPHIYLSEWVAGRFDCGCAYALRCRLANDVKGGPLAVEHKVPQWEGRKWEKVELCIEDYPAEDAAVIFFQHTGCDTQFWAGHYGAKMAGAVLRFVFESMKPL